MLRRVSLKIYGVVQGVFFREESTKLAQRLGLKGFARNEKDGSVWIVAEGEESDLKEFVSWCERGPRLARVEKVDAEWLAPTGEFPDFFIKYQF